MLKAAISTLIFVFLCTATIFSQCQITDLQLSPSDCNNDGNYNLTIDFNYQNPGNNFFDVIYNNQNIGFFELSALPITIQNFQDNGEFSPFITVCINDTPNCCVENEFIAPDCQTGDCHIWDVVATAQCDGSEIFYVQLNFNYENTGYAGFTVQGNGANYGNFEYAQVPITLGPFEAGTGQGWEFVVIDLGVDNCQNFTGLGQVNCGMGGDCHITDLILTHSDCNNDGNYNLTIDFNHQNAGNNFFDLFINSEFYAFYELSNLPITIENFQDGGVAFPVVNVCINDNLNCCAENEFVAPDCGDDCNIFDLFAEAHECDDDGNFLVDFEFHITGQGNEGFTVFGNGMNYGNFEYGQTFYTVGPFSGNGTSIYEIIIRDIQNPDCQNFITIGPIDCSSPNQVWPGDANSDNIANNLDVLNLGIAYGNEGEPRNLQGIEWSGMPAADWAFFFVNAVNFVHADANGNGVANMSDMEAINVNYGLTHGNILQNYDEAGIETDPALFVNLPNADLITLGQPFTAPIVLGTDNIPVENIYGLAFTLVFDPTIIDPASVEISYNNGWMGQNGVNLLTLDKTFAGDGEVDVVLTKNDHNNVSGFGQIAAFIGIIDNIAGKSEVEISIKDVRAINNEEQTVPLRRPVETIEISVATTNQPTNNSINIYPNPATNDLVITNSLHLPMTFCEIRNAGGKLVRSVQQIDHKLDIQDLPSGIYLLKFEIAGHLYYERFVKL